MTILVVAGENLEKRGAGKRDQISSEVDTSEKVTKGFYFIIAHS